MSDTNSTPNYQEILDKYAADLQAASKTIPDVPETPETPTSLETPKTLETTETPETPTSLETPKTLETPEVSQIISPAPEPEPIVPPTPTPTPAPDPIIEIPPQRPEPIVVTPIDSPLPEVKPKENNFFKYLFFISLIIFLGVLAAVIYSFINTQKPLSKTDATPTVEPSLAPAVVCKINDQEYALGANFPASDGCNTCTCNSDTSISCTEKACDLSPTKSATTSASSKDLKTYTNKVYGITFQYPSSFSITDELPKTKTQGGPKTALELNDTKNNYQISIVIDPAGFGIIADKRITLGYSSTKGLFSTKVDPSTEDDEQNLSEDKKILWYQFDGDSLSNITIITNAPKTDTKLETITTQILSTFKFTSPDYLLEDGSTYRKVTNSLSWDDCGSEDNEVSRKIKQKNFFSCRSV